VLVSGEPLTWLWLAVVPVTVLQAAFNTGLCMMLARWAAVSRDVTQLLPFLMTVWRYVSGVFYSILVFTEDLDSWVRTLLLANPATVYIELMRDSMMTSHPAPGFLWWYAAAWAVVSLVVGFVIFYRAEEAYGRG
jgi:teichoic acid transport system permease protein